MWEPNLLTMKAKMNSFKNFFKILVKNWPEKVSCLTLALFLFLFYKISNLEQRYFSVPLRTEASGALTPAAPFLRNVKISLKGEQNEIYPVLEEDIVSFIDLSSFEEEGEYTVPVKTRLSGIAVGIDPLEMIVDPPEVTVKLERKMTKTLPVSVVFTGFPSEGYEFESSAVNPPAVEVTGPRSLIENMTELKTEPVSLAGWNTDFDGSADVITGNELVSLTGLSKVSYRVIINQATSERKFENINFSFLFLNPDFEAESSVENGSLRIIGPDLGLNAWLPPPDLLSVSCTEITEPGEYTLKVQANVPPQFTVLQVDPEEITVTFREKEE